jgi:hypothetical protein
VAKAPHVGAFAFALVGYPAEDPYAERATRAFKERRRPEAQIIHRERWRR